MARVEHKFVLGVGCAEAGRAATPSSLEEKGDVNACTEYSPS
jgi:hypothetical protein